METYYTNSTDYLGGAVLDWEFSMHNIYFQKKKCKYSICQSKIAVCSISSALFETRWRYVSDE